MVYIELRVAPENELLEVKSTSDANEISPSRKRNPSGLQFLSTLPRWAFSDQTKNGAFLALEPF